MSEELFFNNELRRCLDAAGLSDCGENDAWNYWYQRLHKAHDAAVDRVTETQRAENDRLRELLKEACEMARTFYNLGGTFNDLDDLLCEASELGVGVDE